MKLRITLLSSFSILLSLSPVHATEIGTIYIRNNGQSVANVWIDGYYQGYIPAGKTALTTRDGYVTNDSRRLNDGSLYTRPSHAGWPTTGILHLSFRCPGPNDTTIEGAVVLDPAQVGDEPSVWISDGDLGNGPNELDRENAEPILKGTLQDFAKPTEEMAPPLSPIDADKKKLKELEEDVKALEEKIASATPDKDQSSPPAVDNTPSATEEALRSEIEERKNWIKEGTDGIALYKDDLKNPDRAAEARRQIEGYQKEIDVHRAEIKEWEAELAGGGEHPLIQLVGPDANPTSSNDQITAWKKTIDDKNSEIADLEKKLKDEKEIQISFSSGSHQEHQNTLDAEKDHHSLFNDVSGDKSSSTTKPASSVLDQVIGK